MQTTMHQAQGNAFLTFIVTEETLTDSSKVYNVRLLNTAMNKSMDIEHPATMREAIIIADNLAAAMRADVLGTLREATDHLATLAEGESDDRSVGIVGWNDCHRVVRDARAILTARANPWKA